MAANTTPIFTLTPNYSVGQTIATANTAKDGTGTVVTVYTAGANGGMPAALTARAIGTNVATVLRIFINNGSTNTSAANNALFDEMSLPATTLSETAALPVYRYIFPDNFRLIASHKIICTIGTTVAAGYALLCHGNDY